MRGWSLGLDATMEMNQFITWQSHSNSQSWKKRTVSNNTPVMKWERQEKKRQGKHKNGCCVVLVSLLSSQTEVPLKQRWLSVFFTGSMHLLTLAMSFLYCSRWRLLCRTFSLRQFPTELRTNISLRIWGGGAAASGFTSQSDNMCKYILQRRGTIICRGVGLKTVQHVASPASCFSLSDVWTPLERQKA